MIRALNTRFVMPLGLAMRRHRGVIQAIQWAIVLFYLILLVIPAFSALPPREAHIIDNLTLFAQFIFWGIWWPFVILSMLVLGRLWCGVFCPEGALTEWTANHVGRNKTIPRWLKWSGWPVLAFILTTLYGQLISVYDYAQAALLILGGSTLAAIVIGFFFGRQTRVWCRYLCPVSGVFNLLSRLSPLSFKTDQQQWKAYQAQALQRDTQLNTQHFVCPTMMNVHRLNGVAGCHMCGRCAGHRDAVALQLRNPNEEVVTYQTQTSQWADMILLLYGMIGVAIGAFTWTVSPWFVQLKQFLAQILVSHQIFWPLNPTAPWWLLTNYPANNDSFNWLDGFCISLYILGSGLLYGLFLTMMTSLIAKVTGKNIKPIRIALALLPLAAAGLFLGLTATSVKLLQYDGFMLAHLSDMRAILLTVTALWSLYLCWAILRALKLSILRTSICLALFAFACTPIVGAWWLMFWGW